MLSDENDENSSPETQHVIGSAEYTSNHWVVLICHL